MKEGALFFHIVMFLLLVTSLNAAFCTRTNKTALERISPGRIVFFYFNEWVIRQPQVSMKRFWQLVAVQHLINTQCLAFICQSAVYHGEYRCELRHNPNKRRGSYCTNNVSGLLRVLVVLSISSNISWIPLHIACGIIWFSKLFQWTMGLFVLVLRNIGGGQHIQEMSPQ